MKNQSVRLTNIVLGLNLSSKRQEDKTHGALMAQDKASYVIALKLSFKRGIMLLQVAGLLPIKALIKLNSLERLS